MKKQYLSASQSVNQFNRLFSPVSTADIPLNQQNLLFWMATDSTPRTPTNLAKEMRVTKAAITKASGPLLERGLLDKQPDPEDCRSFKLVLSEAGEKAVEDLGPEYLGNLERLYNELGEKKYLKLIKLLSQATGVTVKE
ncbi:MarR family transcriptional regulator [Lacticaseibacillus rhamnosus]|uniref:MarR family transcriptional regulator n=1 Tax=Lacticaseibacillus rhamnosus TaxID=47715 RepID=UPI0008A11040|nr:MarR family transcriptional regulator [Lacticaseibacillus rhamnosus]MDK7181874.1 MarR family transcriptional regulator [Lacticaseibacillus rhamnosus]MDK7239329.1 MarR family transcriptional regulator [Lacticaseibacillus rhamnosus]MDT8863248.1 MarR family transcriptional regulator [Lacticaseibacillus rhamnosus]OFN08247.1 MarR family transcriptional regulator [Lactobacillus sp. HMSC072E07]